MASSAIATNLGRSVLIPSCSRDRQDCLLALLALGGYTGCVSILLLQRSYTTFPQLAAFGGAIVTLSRLFAQQRALQLPQKHLCRHFSSLLVEETDEEDVGIPRSASRCVDALTEHGLTSVQVSILPSTAWVHWIPAVTSILVAWIVFVVINFVPAPPSNSQHQPPTLDVTFQPRYTTEIVISMYNEPLPDVSSLLLSLKSVPSMSNAKIHHQIGAQHVTKRPNVGREGETYLHHILSHWDSLARHTLFIQAGMHNRDQALSRIRSYFDPERTGMMSLGSDMWGWRESASIVSNIYERVYQKPCKPMLLSYKGQFIVSAGRIRGIDKSIYHDLHHALVDSHSWAHQEPYLQGRGDAMSAPAFGFTLERLWSTIFQCSRVETAWQCPSLFSKTKGRGKRTDCQCLDR
ncbi:hypothetical protein BKA66DRAFT_516514 [Pyrenochaeta sp. MPI-SDFR-AT-0127]|nr:hypothetical protein BKA66DRAFT_516514 [Pyrenochaeta sp. MPI-SDFR-AT-0127]